MRILNQLPPPNAVGAEWLAAVRGDARMAGETKTLTIAGEIARLVRGDGAGELPSPVDIGRPVQLSENDVVEAINALIVRGFVALIYKPYTRHVPTFFVRPGCYQQALLQKKPVT